MAEEYDLKTDELIGEPQVFEFYTADCSRWLSEFQRHAFMYLIKMFCAFQSENGDIKARLEHRANGR